MNTCVTPASKTFLNPAPLGSAQGTVVQGMDGCCGIAAGHVTRRAPVSVSTRSVPVLQY